MGPDNYLRRLALPAEVVNQGGEAKPRKPEAAPPAAPAADAASAAGADANAPAAAGAAPTGMSKSQVIALYEEGSYELVPNDGMRKVVAARLTESKRSACDRKP